MGQEDKIYVTNGETNNQTAPMYARQTISGTGSEIVSFSSLGAMLQIVFNSTVGNVTLKSIELIPAGTYSDLSISFYTTDRRVCTMHSSTFPEVKRNSVCRLTLTGTDFKERQLSGPGLFSVGGGRVVKFSRGNLYWNGDSFEFEENQLDYPTTLSLSHIGHFLWSNNADVARAETFDSSGSGEHDVLFTNATEPTPNPDFTVSGVTGEFRTLSGLEWKYLLAHHEQKWVSIGEKAGIALIPDGFEGDLAGTYDDAAWAAAEADGVVFLPAASYRTNGRIKSKSDEGFEVSGRYWTSAPWTYMRAQAAVMFESTRHCSTTDADRGFGSSIRLVKDI